MVLETKRLTLRKFYIKDWKDIVDGQNHKEVVKWLVTQSYPYTKEDALKFIENSKRSWSRKPILSYKFAIELKKEKKIIGGVFLFLVSNDLKKAETVSWINPKYWRKGYITEAKIRLHNFAFNKLKLRKIETSSFSNNIASNNALRKLGFKKEGKRKQSRVSLATGKIHDEYLYGLLKEEWDCKK